MRTKFLAAVASFAFVATGVAYAQDNQRQQEQRPAAERAEPKAPAAMPRQDAAPKAAENNEMKREAPRAAQGEPMRNEPKMGQAERKEQAAETQKNKMERNDAQANQKNSMERKENAQADEKNSMERKENAQADQKNSMERKENARADQNRATDQTRANDQRDDARREARTTGKVQISQEHAVRVSEALRRGARAERTDIDIRVGVRVPESVVVRPLPEEVIAIVPEYRGYDYFVDANDEIVFVSPENHEIVGTIDYEGRAASVDSPRGARPCPVE